MPQAKQGYLTLTSEMRNWILKGLKTTGMTQQDLARECKILKTGVSSIVRGVAKLIDANRWAQIKATFAAKGYGSESLDGPADGHEHLVTQVLALKKKMECSWPDLAATLGVAEVTLKKFTRGTPSRPASVEGIKAGLAKLQELPSKLVAQGVLPAPKASVIEVVPSHSIPSALEIDMKIMELTSMQLTTLIRLRGYHEKPTHLKGSRT